MSKASQGLRAVASTLETITADLSPAAQTALGAAASELHAAADAEAAAEATAIGGPEIGGVIGVFAVTMIDSFFSLFAAKSQAAAPATTPAS